MIKPLQPPSSKVVEMPRVAFELNPADISTMEMMVLRKGQSVKPLDQLEPASADGQLQRLQRDLDHQRELNIAQHKAMGVCFALMTAMGLALILACGVIVHQIQQIKEIQQGGAPTAKPAYSSQAPSVAHTRTPHASAALPVWVLR